MVANINLALEVLTVLSVIARGKTHLLRLILLTIIMAEMAILSLWIPVLPIACLVPFLAHKAKGIKCLRLSSCQSRL